MQASRHNILTRVAGRDQYILANLLSGHADFLTPAEADALQSPAGSFAATCIEKGYWVDPEEEAMRYRLAYIDFLEKRDEEEVQVFFVPTYTCNFQCSYCYQSDYHQKASHFSQELIDGFFSFLHGHLGNRKKYITLFGGEPLLPGAAYKQAIQAFMKRCEAEALDLAIVTNGYCLDEYLPLFGNVSLREIQVTLDGTRDVHDKRRPHRGNIKTFDRISANIDSCLQAGYTVNLRVVLDRENIGNLPELAAYAIEKGWTNHPHFKTQLGRNYELHYCQSAQQKLYTRLELYTDLYDLIKKHPEVQLFHKPAFSIARFLFENESLPAPLFDACPACKAEWALDYTGKIYGCTATVGKPGEELGRFYPDFSLDDNAVKHWQLRDVSHIEACAECSVQLACGGGCGSLAKNEHGSIFSPDCRPVGELLGLGAKLYG